MTLFTDIDDKPETEGFTLRAEIVADSGNGAPWENECGDGPVSDWTGRDKLPGELVLAESRRKKRFYDFAEACRVARAEGWDAKPYNADKRETPKQQAAKAARADFDRLRAWCNDDWSYIGVVVTASKAGVDLGSASLWGIESDADSYLVEVANELTDEAIEAARQCIAAIAA